MTLRSFLVLIVFAGLTLFGYLYTRAPQGTRLPFGSTDLSGVQTELARLPPDERALVESYVKRSGGDVMPASMADPDAPFTARTFAEAIKLQRDWEAKMAVAAEQAEKRRAARESRIAPLRALVQAGVAKAEILTRNDYQARIDPDFYKRPYTVDKSPAFLLRVRVENLGDERIVAMTGSLHAIDREAPLQMDLCWIDLRTQRELAPGESVEFFCGNPNRGAGSQQAAFVYNPPGRFQVVWEPHYVKLESGRELDSGL